MATGFSTSQVSLFEQHSPKSTGTTTVQWARQDVNEEAVSILENIKTGKCGTRKRKSSRLSRATTLFSPSPKKKQDHSQTSKHIPKLTSSSVKPQSMTCLSDEEIDNGLFSLAKFVGSVPVQRRKQYEKKFTADSSKDSHAILQVIETGGLPEYCELLPALMSGLYLHLQVFNLVDDLKSHIEVGCHPHAITASKSEPYLTPLTHKETVMCTLASIGY